MIVTIEIIVFLILPSFKFGFMNVPIDFYNAYLAFAFFLGVVVYSLENLYRK